MLAPTWAISGMLGCLVGGWLSDLLGRRTVLILSTLPFLAGLLVLGLASDLATILVSRALQGELESELQNQLRLPTCRGWVMD